MLDGSRGALFVVVNRGHLGAPEFEPVARLCLWARRFDARRNLSEDRARPFEFAPQAVGAGDLRLQDQRIVARSLRKRGTEALFTARGVVELPEGVEVDCHCYRRTEYARDAARPQQTAHYCRSHHASAH